MTAIPSTFALRRDMDRTRETAMAQMDAKWRQGYAVGQHDAVQHTEKALFVGLAFGICFGVVLTVLATPFLMRFV